MKEAFYFPHDSNAIQDPKMMTLLSECGLMGIGAYWVLIEILHQQDRGAIGMDEFKRYMAFYGKQGTYDQHTLDKCQKVLFETKLLLEKEGMVFSQRVLINKQKREELSQKGRESALKRWGENANPLGTHYPPNAIKERKGKERIHIGFTKPSLEDVKTYCLERRNAVDPERWFYYYESNGWRVGKNPMKDWKAAVRTWEKSSYPESRPLAKTSEVVG